jgi:hypothetical protein
MMRQFTIRQIDAELERRLRNLARQDGISLNRAALKLMHKGAGLAVSDAAPNVVGHALDEHMGTWTENEERQFLASIESCEVIDPAMWK